MRATCLTHIIYQLGNLLSLPNILWVMKCRRYKTYPPKSEGWNTNWEKWVEYMRAIQMILSLECVLSLRGGFSWIKKGPFSGCCYGALWSHIWHRREFLNRYVDWQLLTGDSDLMVSGQEHRRTSHPTLIMTKVTFRYTTPCILQSTVNIQEINALYPYSWEITEKAGR